MGQEIGFRFAQLVDEEPVPRNLRDWQPIYRPAPYYPPGRGFEPPGASEPPKAYELPKASELPQASEPPRGFDPYSPDWHPRKRREHNWSRDELVRQLDLSISERTKNNNSESYLTKAIHLVSGPEENSFQKIQNFREEVIRNEKAPSEEVIEAAIQVIRDNNNELNGKITFDRRAGLFLKSTAMFVPGAVGLTGTMLLTAADRAQPSDKLHHQIIDGVLGATTGGVTRGLIAASRLGPAPIFSATVSGVAISTVDAALNRRSYINPYNGNFEFSKGIDTISNTTLNIDSLSVVVGSALLGGTANIIARNLTGYFLLQNPIARDTITGAGIGMTTGTLGEVYRQYRNSETIDFDKALGVGSESALITAAAALTAGLGTRAVQSIVHRHDQRIPVFDASDNKMNHRYYSKDSDVARFYNQNKESVVSFRLNGEIIGSGFFVDGGGRVVTNHHVARTLQDLTITTSDGRNFPATRVLSSKANDLAVFQVKADDTSSFRHIPLPQPEFLAKGSKVAAFGHPYGNSEVYMSQGEHLRRTKTEIFRSVFNPEKRDYLYRGLSTTAGGAPGNSGGPMLAYPDGRLVGVAASGNRLTGELGAVPANEVIDIVNRAKAAR